MKCAIWRRYLDRLPLPVRNKILKRLRGLNPGGHLAFSFCTIPLSDAAFLFIRAGSARG